MTDSNGFGVVSYASTSEEQMNLSSEEYENRLRILLIAFLREANIPFSVIDNTSFQDIIRHLNPTITPPSFTSLLEMATRDHDKFKRQETMQKHDECQKKIAKEAGEKSSQFLNLRPATQLNPVDFDYGRTSKLPLNLKALPKLADLEAVAHYEADPNLVNFPCTVCLKRQPWSKVRTLTLNEAGMFLFVCISEGVYSLQVAQKVYALKMWKCCTDHFMFVFEAALRLLGIMNPTQVIRAPENLVCDAYTTIRTIKDPNYVTPGNMATQKDKYLGPFRNSLKCFFRNYTPRSKILQGYLDLKPYDTAKIRQKVQKPQKPNPEPKPKPVQRSPSPKMSEPAPVQYYGCLGEVIDFPDELLETENYAVPGANKYDSIENL